MFAWVCIAIGHRRGQNAVKTAVTHSAAPACGLFLPLSDVIFDLVKDGIMESIIN